MKGVQGFHGRPHPHVSIYCPCGAQWHGHYAIDNAVVTSHAKRCGEPITEKEFIDRGFKLGRKPWHTRRQKQTGQQRS